MATYQVRSGHRFGSGNQYGPGDKIELSAEEAAGFLDKLELVEEADEGAPNTDDKLGQIVPWHGLDPKLVALLEAAGVTEELVSTMTDEELVSIDGIGPKAVEKIRSAFSGDAE